MAENDQYRIDSKPHGPRSSRVSAGGRHRTVSSICTHYNFRAGPRVNFFRISEWSLIWKVGPSCCSAVAAQAP